MTYPAIWLIAFGVLALAPVTDLREIRPLPVRWRSWRAAISIALIVVAFAGPFFFIAYGTLA